MPKEQEKGLKGSIFCSFLVKIRLWHLIDTHSRIEKQKSATTTFGQEGKG